MEVYNKFLKLIENKLGKESTDSEQLNIFCKILFGNKFRGVYAYDQPIKLEKGESAIFNLDTSDKPGSHWVAVCKSNRYITYDSFGRNIKKISNSLFTEKDREQEYTENNCGQRCIAFLCVWYSTNDKIALSI
jgi:hypothetical protein